MFRRLSALFVALAFVAFSASSAGAQTSPLLGTEFNCAEAQAAFGGNAQPAPVGQTVPVELSTSCYLVLSTQIEGGQVVNITYLSGPFDTLNIAFYLAGAGPGQSFNNPPNAELGTPWGGRAVPGAGTQTVFIVVQGAGGPATGSATVRVGSRPPTTPTTTAAPTTAAPTTAAPTTAAPTTAAPTTAAPTTAAPGTTGTDDAATASSVAETTTAPTSSVVAISPEDTTSDADDAAEVDDTTDSDNTDSENTGDLDDVAAGADDDPNTAGPSDEDGGVSPWWVLLPLAGLAAAGAAVAIKGGLFGAAVVPPWERNIVRWTLQHTVPTGTCSSNARVVVDPDDDGSLASYSISELFTLPTIKRRMRSTAGDQLLTQFDTLWANGGSGPELRSSVDVFANSLCRHLDAKRVPGDATLLTELTKSDVRLSSGLHACADGTWQTFATVGEIPDLPGGELQHDLVQVVVLAANGAEEANWSDRSEELTEAITTLIETRRAPAGLWVFD